jgi:DNA gyrase subunit B
MQKPCCSRFKRVAFLSERIGAGSAFQPASHGVGVFPLVQLSTTPPRSTNSRGWRRSASGRGCISEIPTSAGLHHCVFEVLDNSIDEHLAGHCNRIEVTVHVDGSVSIRDNGRGIPVDMHPKWKMPAVELVLTNLHAGGKFGQGAYKYSGGLHGVGAKCVNALSEWFKVEVSRDGLVYYMEFARGVTTRKLEVIGKSKNTGTLITFKPDAEIFTITTEFKFDVLANRLRELAFLNPGVEIVLRDEREEDKQEIGSLPRTASRSSCGSWASNKQTLHPQTRRPPPQGRGLCGLRAAIQRQLQRPDPLFCQLDRQPGRRHASDRLSHRADPRHQPVRAQPRTAQGQGPRPLGRRRARGPGLRAERQTAQPRFESQTKVKLVNTEIEGLVASVIYDGLMTTSTPTRGGQEGDRQGVDGGAGARGGAQGARNGAQERADRGRPARQAGGLFGSRSRRAPSCSLSRAIRPAARPSRGGTGGSRRSCRSAAS